MKLFLYHETHTSKHFEAPLSVAEYASFPGGGKTLLRAVLQIRDIQTDEMKKYDSDYPFAKEIVRQDVVIYINNIDIPNLKEAEDDTIYSLVNEDLNLILFTNPVATSLENLMYF